MFEDPESEKYLWDYSLRQKDHIFTQLATGLVGLGALFFAYASLRGSPDQPIIALVGLGGSLVLWLRCLSANKSRTATLDAIYGAPKARKAFAWLQDMATWRDKGAYLLYVPSTAAATWFMGWVAVAWLWIIVTSYVSVSLPQWGYALIVVLAFALTYFGLLQTAKVRRAKRNPPKSSAGTPGQTKETEGAGPEPKSAQSAGSQGAV